MCIEAKELGIKTVILPKANANEAAAFIGFSALASPHPIVPIAEPHLAPLSTLSKLEPPPTACIPNLVVNSNPAPSKAEGFAVAISAAEPHFATPFTPRCLSPK